jgi:hypothetical protein
MNYIYVHLQEYSFSTKREWKRNAMKETDRAARRWGIDINECVDPVLVAHVGSLSSFLDDAGLCA